MGQETEYAIRFSATLSHPGNDRIYGVLARAIAQQVRTEPGLYPGRPQIFLQNGGGFHYEYRLRHFSDGLIEGATPECRGPAQLLLYQKAQEALLRKVIPAAESSLGAQGFPGKLGLLKNCRDAEGHVYGAQESFQVNVADGLSLVAYRIGLAALLPGLAATIVAGWLLVLAVLPMLALGVVIAVLAALPPFRRRGWIERLMDFEEHALKNALGRVKDLSTWPFFAALWGLLELFAFRRIRRTAMGFFVSRAIFSGAGTVDADGRFSLSEKGAAINRLLRVSMNPRERPIFDTGNLMRPAFAASHFHLGPVGSLFRRKQRLQLGLADSIMLEEAEFLKMGATALVIDMAEAGFIEDAPRLRDPIAALHTLVADPTLEARVDTSAGERTALELQRYYLDKATAFVKGSKATSLEAAEVVDLWEQVLTALEQRQMSKLVGRIDWVTKRYLLEACGDQDDAAMLKTIDLRYHELGEGYAERLSRTGNVHRLVAPVEIERAIEEPPEGTPAYTRGRFIRSRDPDLTPVRISWDSAVIGGRLRGKVVRFPERGGSAE
jgi:proteasome accessory factor A